MKNLKMLLLLVALVFLTCTISYGQRIIHTEATCMFDKYDMGSPIGLVDGYIIYHFTIRLSKETGKIESLQWHTTDCNIINEAGERVISLDAGHDTQGVLWDFFNKPNYWNSVLYSDKCTYNVEDGWWNDIMPESLPEEGTFIGNCFKLIYNGEVFRGPFMSQIHINANGDVVVNFIKP